MPDQFLAEIRIFTFATFAPKGWAWCNGQLLPISSNTALFSLLGTTYGGDGKSTFALPDLSDRAPMHPGEGAGLSPHVLGEVGGQDAVKLVQSEMPVHYHAVQANGAPADLQLPGPDRTLARSTGGNAYAAPAMPFAQLAPQAVTPAGGDQPHNNMMPYLTLAFCIALQGIFPPRP